MTFDPFGSSLLLAGDPVAFARQCGLDPDPTQAQILTSKRKRILLNCTRQWGKSSICAMKSLHAAIFAAPANIVLVSPSQNQSQSLLDKVRFYWSSFSGAPKALAESQSRIEFENGSKLYSLPGSERTVRGISAARLIIIDEAARVEDALVAAVTPMMAVVPDAQLLMLSTPSGTRGAWANFWLNGGDSWERFRVTAEQCPRISEEFLAAERAALGEVMFQQEYLCRFHNGDDGGTAVFDEDFIKRIFSDDDDPNFRPFFSD
jgi:Terminase large subunit, T4likevirus-type, N-terminal